MKRRQFIKSSSLLMTGLATRLTSGCQQQEQQAQQQDETQKNMMKKTMGSMPDYAAEGVKLLTDSTPAADGFYFPAEWAKHEYTMMQMAPPQNWAGFGFSAKEVRKQWADVANAIAEYEPVLMVVRPEDKKHAVKLLDKEIELIELPLNDGWARDSGPMFVVNGKGERRVIAPTFNGWGEKMDGMFHEDEMLKARLCKQLDLAMYPVDVCMEGGGVVMDGDGTMITNEQCMMHKTRNPGLSKTELEKRLNAAFGTTKVLWTGNGLEPDPITDGHVDGMMAYVDSGVLLLSSTKDKSDPNYKICLDAKKRLQDVTDAKGRKIEIIDLPLTRDGGHMNFYIANGCVVVPTTGDRKQDDAPMAILKELFDDRDVFGISGRVLGDGGGGIHCITQQVPAV